MAVANNWSPDPMSIAREFATGMMDETDLYTLAEATQDLYAAYGFFGFDPYDRKNPEELTMLARNSFNRIVRMEAHYALFFPERGSGPPHRKLMPGPAPDTVELSWSTDPLGL